VLADYPAHTLHETIKNFHNTKSRYAALKEVIARDPLGRAASVQAEIDFALAHEPDGAVLVDLLAAGKLPLRVTHNDTKLNNILLDKDSGLAICVIDLDTVMPGLAATDFGDAIRFGANTSTEDEQDLSKVCLDLGLYETYTEGFLKGCNGSLTELEIETLPHGAKIMCLECGVRFLTDYIDGDNYFRIHREGHNLDRCRTQFKLVSEIDRHWNELCDITAKYSK
jgi:serine/threonine protein kinase